MNANNMKISMLLFALAVMLIVSGCGGPKYVFKDTPKVVIGNPDAKVTVLEFSDLQCPACRNAHPIVKRITDEYKDYIRFEFYHFPLQSLHPYAFKAAEAAECANDQGKFWDFIDDSYTNQEKLKEDDLRERADKLGLNMTEFNACLDSGDKGDVVKIDMREGLNRNVDGTPTFYINNKKLQRWDYDSFKAEIDGTLAVLGVVVEQEAVNVSVPENG